MIEAPTLAGLADAGALAVLHARAFPPARAWSGAAIAGLLASPGVLALHHPGGVLLVRIAGDEAEILTLGVVPEARRHGLARGLLGAALGLAAARGARMMFLEVAAANAPARALYAAAGFTEAGRRTAYYENGEDALVLAVALTPCGSARS